LSSFTTFILPPTPLLTSTALKGITEKKSCLTPQNVASTAIARVAIQRLGDIHTDLTTIEGCPTYLWQSLLSNWINLQPKDNRQKLTMNADVGTYRVQMSGFKWRENRHIDIYAPVIGAPRQNSNHYMLHVTSIVYVVPVWRRVRIPPPHSLRVVRGDKGT
jgi:hypothetical protein